MRRYSLILLTILTMSVLSFVGCTPITQSAFGLNPSSLAVETEPSIPVLAFISEKEREAFYTTPGSAWEGIWPGRCGRVGQIEIFSDGTATHRWGVSPCRVVGGKGEDAYPYVFKKEGGQIILEIIGRNDRARCFLEGDKLILQYHEVGADPNRDQVVLIKKKK